MHKPFWALLFLLSSTYSAALADDPTSEKLSDLLSADGLCKGWGGVAPAPSENECRSFIEAALKEQRTQTEAGGDATDENTPITQDEQYDTGNQVNEETTADTSTENIGSAEPSEVVVETNEKVEISEAESQEQGAPVEEDEISATSTAETLTESFTEETPLESAETLKEGVINESGDIEGVLAESANTEAPSETVEAEERVTDSTETEGVPVESSEMGGVTEASAETEGVPVDFAEIEGVLAESVEIEGVPVDPVESGTEAAPSDSVQAEEIVTESFATEPEETLAESGEAESMPIEKTDTGAAADKPVQEAEGSAESAGTEAVVEPAERTEAVTESAEGTEAVTESAERTETVTESAEGIEAVTGSAEGTETLTESAEGTEFVTESADKVESVEDITGTLTEEKREEEPVESTEGEVQKLTEDIQSAEETVTVVVTESTVSSAETVEPVSQEEVMLSDQPAEIDVSAETIFDQNVESQPEQPEVSSEKEAVTEQPNTENIFSEEIVEVAQENVESKEASTTASEPVKSEVESIVEKTTEEEIPISAQVSTEVPELLETSSEPTRSVIEEELQSKAGETSTPLAAVEEAPTEVVENAEPIAESPTEKVSESIAEVEDIAIEEETPEQEDLTLKIEIPENLRPRNHITETLKLDSESVDTETKLLKAEESTLKELKRVYEAAIKPLEILYKYRDLSNRHFGDPEIFSKPLILFMGPWSGGKSTIINYLLDNEYKPTALRSGAEPSPAYFNIVMWGEREEVMDGTQLAADWTFSGLQKFGQGLLDRLRGLKLNSPLLEKVNIVEIPGILEIRKQVERLFPLNDACQWFIDRADIIFLVYDPSKLDVGPETEAILDQLKGREYQTKIILNKADQVKPEELMRVQGTLIWNISPLMSSTEPPVMYSTSLWSHPYQPGSPSRLLFAQEKAFLKDLREAMEKRVENKISSARRFAVRVRNHAKMVDCYLTTYYNHKTFFGNKQKVSDDIIEHPQNYHIYEGLSTLTNISRYDLPDPDVYRDFFRLNPVYDFQQLSSTCTYFKGCPINRLDVAIAYDLPELVGKFKKAAEDLKKQGKK